MELSSSLYIKCFRSLKDSSCYVMKWAFLVGDYHVYAVPAARFVLCESARVCIV